ncbi:biotin transporter BioY [Ruegeria sp. 2205SS24-7]|uniref:biotin transporter BioY n=1 Tax=Ruegeria discodermiae TaxID=3064389 RepID=UPI002741977E|nr:biotin transporter BioY [Ruegeria sp. 2205SS24-7]MDP5218421.1 biotin transporter BioY [Ruegeria sp. 2205SS24-7]
MKSTHSSALPVAGSISLPGQAIRVVAGVLLLTLSAKVQVPFWPVPMTLQVAAVMTLAAAYGLRLGAATLVGYLILGALGAPVFAGTPEKGIGLAYMVGGTGGYLLGFVAAAVVVGWAADHLRKLFLWPAMLLGLAMIYVLGLGWLAQFVPGDKILAYGFTPFIAGDLVKITLASVAVLGLPRGLLSRIRGTKSDA